MHARRTLRKLLAEYGLTLLDNPQRVDALLADLCRSHHRERFLLVHALLERIPKDLQKQTDVNKAFELRLSQRLRRKYCFSAEAALWAVESWSIALDIAPPSSDAHHDSNKIPNGNYPAFSESPQRVLAQLLATAGPELLIAPARVDGLLADLSGQHPRERFLLVHGLREHIPFELLVEQRNSSDRRQQLSNSLQSRFGLATEAVQWTLESWSSTLEAARSGPDQAAAEASEALAEAQETARAIHRRHAESVSDAHRKVELFRAANGVANQKVNEHAAATEIARIKEKERAVAHAAYSLAVEEWTTMRMAASSIAKEVEEIMLQVLDGSPMNSQEVAEILDRDQEHVTSWLQGLMNAGKVEYEWLERSPHLPGYRSKISKSLPSIDDFKSANGVGVETAARLRVEDQTSAEAAALEKEQAQAAMQEALQRKTEEWLAAESEVLNKTKEQEAALAEAHLKDQEQHSAEAAARLKAEELAVAEELVRRKLKNLSDVKTVARRKKDEWLAAEAKARQFVKDRTDAEAAEAGLKRTQELNTSILRNLERRPLTSRELASILGKEQEQIVALLRRFQEAGEVEQVWLSRSPQFPCYRLRDYPYASAPAGDQSKPSHIHSSFIYRGWVGMLWLWLGNVALVAVAVLWLGLVLDVQAQNLAEAAPILIVWGAVTGFGGLAGMVWLWIGRVLLRAIGIRDKLSPRAMGWLGMLWLWTGAMGVVGAMKVMGVLAILGITDYFALATGLGGVAVGVVGMLWLWLGRVLLRLLGAFVR